MKAKTAHKDKTDRRRQIMQAAEKLFTSRRLHEITMDDVAALAGVAKGTLYTYFQDKDDLFFQTGTSGFEELCELLERSVPEQGSFPEQLLGACRQIIQFFERRHQLLQMMQAEERRMSYCHGDQRERWLEKRKKLVSAVAAILQRGVAAGRVRGDVRPEALANILLGMLRTQVRDLAAGAAGRDQHKLIVELFCNGAGGDGRAHRNC